MEPQGGKLCSSVRGRDGFMKYGMGENHDIDIKK